MKRVAIIVAASVAALYLVGVWFFSTTFPPHTSVNGENVSMKSIKDYKLDELLSVKTETVKFFDEGSGYKEAATFDSLGVYRNYDMNSIRVNSWIWPITMIVGRDYKLDRSFVYNEAKLEKGLSQLDCVKNPNVEDPKDAYMALGTSGKFEVVKEETGTRIDMNNLVAVTKDVLGNGNEEVNLVDCYKKPAVLSDDEGLAKLCDKSNEILAAGFSIDLGGGLVKKIPADTLGRILWYSNGKLTVKQDEVNTYAESLAAEYDTFNTSRELKIGNNKIRLSPKEGDTFYGWTLNVKDTAKAISDAINGSDIEKGAVATAVWDRRGAGHGKKNDFGDNYIVVSIADQHMWAYSDGKLLVDTDVTTGMDVPGRRTPTGMFWSLNWNREYTMHGSYGSSFCHYFIGVTSYGVAVHDAPWRDRYGGNIYVANGSHGCINTPYNAMHTIFETLVSHSDDKIPIIIY